MVENVSPLGPLKGPAGPGTPGKTAPVEGERSFKAILQDSIENVNSLQQEADKVLEKFYRGEADQDQLVMAVKKSQLAFETLMQIRNKLMDAFDEIQRMRI